MEQLAADTICMRVIPGENDTQDVRSLTVQYRGDSPARSLFKFIKLGVQPRLNESLDSLMKAPRLVYRSPFDVALRIKSVKLNPNWLLGVCSKYSNL